MIQKLLDGVNSLGIGHWEAIKSAYRFPKSMTGPKLCSKWQHLVGKNLVTFVESKWILTCEIVVKDMDACKGGRIHPFTAYTFVLQHQAMIRASHNGPRLWLRTLLKESTQQARIIGRPFESCMNSLQLCLSAPWHKNGSACYRTIISNLKMISGFY